MIRPARPTDDPAFAALVRELGLQEPTPAFLDERDGVREWHLNVSPDNTPAIRLYEKLGLVAEHRSAALRLPWSAVDLLPRAPASAWPVAVAEDDDVERSLGLLTGQVAMARRRPGHVLRQLRDPACAAVGLAAFDPAVPGACLFRVARPALAGTLLAALRPFARHDGLSLVIEDDEALGELLLAHGATIRRQLLHFRGAIPASADP